MKVQASLRGMRINLHESSLKEIELIWTVPSQSMAIGAVYQIVGADGEKPEVEAVQRVTTRLKLNCATRKILLEYRDNFAHDFAIERRRDQRCSLPKILDEYSGVERNAIQSVRHLGNLQDCRPLDGP